MALLKQLLERARLRSVRLDDTVTHMKTTIDIADSLLEEAKTVAALEKTTVKSLVESGLRKVLSGRRSAGSFQLRQASFKGQGVQPGLTEGDWSRIREIAYEGRGG